MIQYTTSQRAAKNAIRSAKKKIAPLGKNFFSFCDSLDSITPKSLVLLNRAKSGSTTKAKNTAAVDWLPDVGKQIHCANEQKWGRISAGHQSSHVNRCGDVLQPIDDHKTAKKYAKGGSHFAAPNAIGESPNRTTTAAMRALNQTLKLKVGSGKNHHR